jgi:hypothetical protein
VFNAAAKSGEKCLNDFMTCEPALQNPLPVFFRGDLGSNIYPSNPYHTSPILQSIYKEKCLQELSSDPWKFKKSSKA